jgi:hypothetical protein
MVAYFRVADEGASLLRQHTRLDAWWARMARRRSVVAVCLPPA